MKLTLTYFLVCILAIALGVVPAYLYFTYETQTTGEPFFTDQWSQDQAGSVGAIMAILGRATHDFGTISPDQEYRHEFIIQNSGDQTLEIWTDQTGNSPIQTDLGSERISIIKGGSYPVTVSFSGKDIDAELNEKVVIRSNDSRPGKSTLEISLFGKVQP